MGKLTGHLEEIGVVSHYIEEVADLEAENARLRSSGANVSGLLIGAVETGGKAIAEIERERDGYKALAEQLRAEMVEIVDGQDSTMANQIRDLILNLDDGTLADELTNG